MGHQKWAIKRREHSRGIDTHTQQKWQNAVGTPYLLLKGGGRLMG
jgi:hypothetical protein